MSMNIARKVAHVGAAAALVSLAAVTTASPAAADLGPPPGCQRGYFCTSGGPDSPTSWSTAVNWSGRTIGIFLFNNGFRSPGVDHVDVTYYRAQDGSGPYTRCIHYYPGPGQYYVYTPNDPVEIVRVRWRGEC
ncbi:hypothetical protein [Sphaerisporangium corydalis]|uniref:Peptidase inhibitor family I36 protein n=1 Tax=Sphaerisporangium corydalis TaxID=1441875 RepID=A0ABV9E862_9ACTN|nr:hypothetical protein [Sphaerisporangium corydalis]